MQFKNEILSGVFTIVKDLKRFQKKFLMYEIFQGSIPNRTSSFSRIFFFNSLLFDATSEFKTLPFSVNSLI